jgi:hypothetical protein
MFDELTVLMQTYHQKKLTATAIRSFEKYKPDNLKITYIVVEGSEDDSYKQSITSLAKNVKWYNNKGGDIGDPINGASTANGLNLEFGKAYAQTDWVFVCHNDVAVQSSNFYKVLQQHAKNYCLISCCKDPLRIGACHISGLLVKNSILQKVDCMPDMPRIDVGDRLTEYCRENNLNYISLPNTHNTPDLWNDLTGIWSSVGKDCGVDRCVIDGEVIFCHLGRGIPKFFNQYFKQGKISHDGWCLLHEQHLGV